MRKMVCCGFAMTLALGAGVPAVCGYAQAAAGERTVPNRQAVLQQAHDAYYNLRNRGVVSFQCNIVPDWVQVFADAAKQNPAGAQNAIQMLQQLHFVVNFGTDGTAKVTHNDLTGQTQQMKDALSQMYGGMSMMVTSFFQTWSMFMYNNPFPDVNSEYALVDLGPRYRLTYKDGTTDVMTTMGHDFAMDTMTVTTPSDDSSIVPRLTATPEGLVLAGYRSTYKSQNASETTDVSVDIQYVRQQGLETLQKLNIAGTYGGSSFHVAIPFSNCQMTMK